jgi:hypothetical protein
MKLGFGLKIYYLNFKTMYLENMAEEVVKFAQEQIGKQEHPGNQGFEDPFLDNLMRQVGFENGWAWCALFAEACWRYPTFEGKSQVIATISDCFSANAVRTLENFDKDDSGYFKVNKEAAPGAVVIFEKRRGGVPVKTGIWTLGHAGIVEAVQPNLFVAIEGNTNSSGGREGIEVARKNRTYNMNGTDGLCVLGFIHPVPQ